MFHKGASIHLRIFDFGEVICSTLNAKFFLFTFQTTSFSKNKILLFFSFQHFKKMAFRSQRPIGNSLFDEKRDSSIQWWKVILGIVFVGMVFFIIFSRNTVQTHLENEAKNNNNNNNVEEVKVKTASPTKAKNANSVTIVKCDTTKGPITIEVHPAWARRGAKRFLEMVEKNFFEKLLFYRVPDPNSNALMQIGKKQRVFLYPTKIDL